jgi:serine-type D-Ala-D-Ala carboxypeptidase
MHNPISKFLQERIDVNDFPSAVYLVAERGEIEFHEALGCAVVEPEKISAMTDTIYDLASLTKPLVTGLLAVKNLEIGMEFCLDDHISKLFSELDSNEVGEITFKNLLTHTSGLKAWHPFYLESFQPGREAESAKETIFRLPPDEQPNSSVIYSDLNFILLERLLSKRATLTDLARSELFLRLGLQNTFFNPVTELKSRIAASEIGNEYEKNTCIELGYLQPYELRTPHSAFRNYQIWGEVHDGNAWFMGGIAGHAGLFSTAEEVFKIALQFLPDHTTLMKPETTKFFRTNFTKGMNEARSIAFQLAETPQSTAGSRMSPESFGHLGFTGTSLWIDPVKDRIFILLTNRTHAHPLPFVNINSVRRRFHDLANDLLDKKTLAT